MWVQSFYLLLFSSIYPLLSHLWLCVSVRVSLPLFRRKKPTKRSQKVPQLCQHCHNLNRRAMPCERGGGYPRTARTPLSADQISCSCTWQSWGRGGLGGLLLKYTRITLKKKPHMLISKNSLHTFIANPAPLSCHCSSACHLSAHRSQQTNTIKFISPSVSGQHELTTRKSPVGSVGTPGAVS